MKDQGLLGVLLGVLILGAGIAALLLVEQEDRLVPFVEKRLPVKVELELGGVETPDSPEPAPTDSSAETAAVLGKTVGIYLDISEPMAGYLSPADDTEQQGLQSVVQLIPDHLLTLYGPVERLEWLEFDQQVHPARLEPRFGENVFLGAETFLDQAIDHGLKRLASGESHAFAVVSDLVATHSGTGAVGLLSVLGPWIRGEAVRSGAYDIGLIGIRVPFRGVHNGKCKMNAPLGCWFSERNPGWRPLIAKVDRPLYVLVLGKRVIDSGARSTDESLVDRVGEALRTDVEGIGMEAQWQLLSAGARDRDAELVCSARSPEGASSGKQRSLRHRRNGEYRCLQEKTVWIDCSLNLESKEWMGSAVRLQEATTSWGDPWVESSVENGEIRLGIHCAAVQQEAPPGPLMFERLVAGVDESQEMWTSWSVEGDHREDQLDRTLQLRHFVAATQPERFQVRPLEPLLGAAGPGSRP